MDSEAVQGGQPQAGQGQGQLVLSAEDAAQLLAQAGIQLGDNEHVVVNNENAAANNSELEAAINDLNAIANENSDANVVNNGGNGAGTVLYIDPNDPQAAEILEQAGLRLTEDGQVTQLEQGLLLRRTLYHSLCLLLIHPVKSYLRNHVVSHVVCRYDAPCII